MCLLSDTKERREEGAVRQTVSLISCVSLGNLLTLSGPHLYDKLISVMMLIGTFVESVPGSVLRSLHVPTHSSPLRKML